MKHDTAKFPMDIKVLRIKPVGSGTLHRRGAAGTEGSSLRYREPRALLRSSSAWGIDHGTGEEDAQAVLGTPRFPSWMGSCPHPCPLHHEPPAPLPQVHSSSLPTFPLLLSRLP